MPNGAKVFKKLKDQLEEQQKMTHQFFITKKKIHNIHIGYSYEKETGNTV